MAELPPDAYHFYFASLDPGQLLDDDNELATSWLQAGPFSAGDAADLIVPFEVFLREVTTSQRFRAQGLRHAASHLLIEAIRLLSADSRRPNLAVHRAVAETRRLIDGDPARNHTLAELAVHVHLSPSYLAQLFAAQMGESPARYRRQTRLRRAEILLAETDRTVTEIAMDLGFSSPQHFATVFHRHRSMTPRAFRAQRQTAVR